MLLWLPKSINRIIFRKGVIRFNPNCHFYQYLTDNKSKAAAVQATEAEAVATPPHPFPNPSRSELEAISTSKHLHFVAKEGGNIYG